MFSFLPRLRHDGVALVFVVVDGDDGIKPDIEKEKKFELRGERGLPHKREICYI